MTAKEKSDWYTLNLAGNVQVNGNEVRLGKNLHGWNTAKYQATLNHYASGWSLVVKYYQPLTVDNRSRNARPGWQTFRQKRFVCQIGRSTVCDLKNGLISPGLIVDRHYRIIW